MTTSLQVDSYRYRCGSCGKLRMSTTRMLDFNCIKEQWRDRGRERVYEADTSYTCQCGQTINIKFRVCEYPEDVFNYENYSSADAEIISEPKIREHLDMNVDLG